jgi:hypothetical protein
MRRQGRGEHQGMRNAVSIRTWLLGGAAIGCALALFFARSTELGAGLTQTVFNNLVVVLPVGVVAVSATWSALQFDKREPVRRQWLLVALGLVSFEIGGLIQAYYELVLGRPVPYPGLPDVFYLLWYPLVGLALVAAIMSLSKLFDPTRTLVISYAISIAAAAVTWYFVLHPTAADSGLSVAANTLNTLYPLANLLVLMPFAIALSVLAEKLAGGRIALPWRVLVVGLAAIVIANVGFMVMATAWASTTGDVSDLFEALGYTIVGISVLVALDVHGPTKEQREG